MTPTLAIVEDQELFRRLLVDLCARHFGFPVVAEAGTVAQAIECIPPAAPDVVLLDLHLPDGDGLDLAASLYEKLPRLKILALTSLRDEVTIHRIRTLGVQGFVDKNVQMPDALREAIEAVASGRVYFAEVVQQVQQAIRTDPESFAKLLSDREVELISLLGRGLSNEEVAAKLDLTPWTIHSHRRNIMKKIGANNQAELMRYALRKGFVRPSADQF
jgi:DNA-binding NarL/FixJ family response regulator